MHNYYSEDEVVCCVAQVWFVSQAFKTLNNSGGFVLLLEVHLCDPFRCYLIPSARHTYPLTRFWESMSELHFIKTLH